MDAIRIFVGTEEKTTIFYHVLRRSILTRTKAPVTITPMIDDAKWTYPTNNIRVGTGFSLRRWLIPENCDWHGRAIYLDADQLVLADIAELWDIPRWSSSSPGMSAWLTYQPDRGSNGVLWPQTSVMLIDCAAAKEAGFGWRRNEMIRHLAKYGGNEYRMFQHAQWMRPQPGKIPDVWNHLDTYKAGKTKLLHYTNEAQQPSYAPGLSRAYLWQAELKLAIEEGFVSREAFEAALAKWKVRDDWRKQNGLHPFYRDYLKYFPQG